MKIAMILLSLMVVITAAGQVDLSGSWKLNNEKSQFNTIDPSSISTKMMIEQQLGNITFEGNKRAKETFRIDSTIESEVAVSDYKAKVTIQPTADKEGLIEKRIYVYAEGKSGIEAKKTRTWKLSGDKKTLIIENLIELNDGQVVEMTLIYDRQ
jgi:hypothetical protein